MMTADQHCMQSLLILRFHLRLRGDIQREEVVDSISHCGFFGWLCDSACPQLEDLVMAEASCAYRGLLKQMVGIVHRL